MGDGHNPYGVKEGCSQCPVVRPSEKTVQQCQFNANEEVKIGPDFRNHRATGGQGSGTRGDVGKTPGITGTQGLDSGT
jgi:hypothetical protein